MGLDDDDEISLVFIRHEASRHAREHKISQPQTGENSTIITSLYPSRKCSKAPVPSGEGGDAVVKTFAATTTFDGGGRSGKLPPAREPE